MEVTLLIRSGASHLRSFRMKSDQMIIGRMRGADLRVPSGSVSRQHCKLRIIDGILRVEDLKSANGTFVNGAMISDSACVKPGDLLTVGPVTFEIQYALSQQGRASLAKEQATAEYSEAPLPMIVDDDFPAERRNVLLEAIEMEEEGQTIEAPAPEKAPLEKGAAKKKKKREPKKVEAPAEDEAVEDEPKKKKKKKGESELSPDFSMMMQDEGPYQLPEGDKLRDLLARLEDEEE